MFSGGGDHIKISNVNGLLTVFSLMMHVREVYNLQPDTDYETDDVTLKKIMGTNLSLYL